MQFNRKTYRETADQRWTKRRNRLVCKLLDQNPRMTRGEALAEANQQLKNKNLPQDKRDPSLGTCPSCYQRVRVGRDRPRLCKSHKAPTGRSCDGAGKPCHEDK